MSTFASSVDPAALLSWRPCRGHAFTALKFLSTTYGWAVISHKPTSGLRGGFQIRD